MKNKDYWVDHLNMIKHPEGGYFTPTYTAPHTIKKEHINEDFEGSRALATSIYFLIAEGDVSNFHRLKADELWYFHSGSPLTISIIDPDGNYREAYLGLDMEKGQHPQVLVPAGSIFGSFTHGEYALVGCMVTYGFDFNDFELFERADLLSQYPQHGEIITKLTNEA